jgi:hypothetical protein
MRSIGLPDGILRAAMIGGTKVMPTINIKEPIPREIIVPVGGRIYECFELTDVTEDVCFCSCKYTRKQPNQ